MAIRTIGIIVHGATGRIGATQHLKNALTPIRAEGGLAVGEDRVMPQLILVGRDKERLAAIARENGGAPWTTDLDAALSDRRYTVLFDAAATHQRQATLEKGIAAGKHIYAEKPVALTVTHGRALLAPMMARGLKHGAVADKQHLPGLRKLRTLAQAGFFGRIVGFRLEFGWWGVRRRRRTVPAAELELPQGWRRRPPRRHVFAFSLPHRRPAWADPSRVHGGDDGSAGAPR